MFLNDATRRASAPAEANLFLPIRMPCQVTIQGRFAAQTQRHGGDGRDRTDDLMLAKQLLSQLSYVP